MHRCYDVDTATTMLSPRTTRGSLRADLVCLNPLRVFTTRKPQSE